VNKTLPAAPPVAGEPVLTMIYVRTGADYTVTITNHETGVTSDSPIDRDAADMLLRFLRNIE
jgi:hypothetical protein